jgi:DNA-binding NarL/FixJ family response regulator
VSDQDDINRPSLVLVDEPTGNLDSARTDEILALMAEGRSNQAICERLFVTPKTVEAHIASIFSKLELLPAPDDHRRVLAVLAYLRK